MDGHELSAADIAAVTKDNGLRNGLMGGDLGSLLLLALLFGRDKGGLLGGGGGEGVRDTHLIEREAINTGKLDGIERQLLQKDQEEIVRSIGHLTSVTERGDCAIKDTIKEAQAKTVELFERQKIQSLEIENVRLRNELSQEHQTLTILRALGVFPVNTTNSFSTLVDPSYVTKTK